MIDVIGAFVANIIVTISANESSHLLRSLLDMQDEQLKLLRILDRNVKDILEGPFYAACVTLKDANEPWRTEEARLAFLTEARQLLVLAVGQFKSDHFKMSLAAANLAAVWLLIGSSPDARKWLNISRREAEAALSLALQTESAWRRARGIAADYGEIGRWAASFGRHTILTANAKAESRLLPIARWAAALREVIRATEEITIPSLRIIRIESRYFESADAIDAPKYRTLANRGVVYEE